jgi:hypothetical protein
MHQIPERSHTRKNHPADRGSVPPKRYATTVKLKFADAPQLSATNYNKHKGNSVHYHLKLLHKVTSLVISRFNYIY